MIELRQRLVRFDRIGVNNLVPNPLLPFFCRQFLNVLADNPQFRQGRDIETGARLEQGPDNFRIGVGLDRVIGLHARQVLLKGGVVAPQFCVIHYKQRRAVFSGEPLERGERNHGLVSVGN